MTSNAQKQREEFTTLESIFGKDSFTVEKQPGVTGKNHDKLIKLKLTKEDTISLLIPSGYPTSNIPILLRSGKSSRHLSDTILDQIDNKLKEVFSSGGDGQLYELFHWFLPFFCTPPSFFSSP